MADGPAGMRVPLIDIRAQYLSIKDEIDESIARVHERGNYVMGEEVERFEQSWAAFCGARYTVAVSSCTDALYLTFRALKELYGYDSVVTTPFTFAASVEAPLRAGWRVALADVDDVYPACFASPQVGHILGVNLYGYPAENGTQRMTTPRLLVEDAAQSHGIPLRGVVACHSYYPTKNLGAMGMAGSVVTDNRDVADYIRVLRTHGESGGRFHHTVLSGNYRMDEVQAAVLNAKLPHLIDWNKARRRIAGRYDELLEWLPRVTLPPEHPDCVYHIYSIQVQVEERDEIIKQLLGDGIQTAVRYPFAITEQPAFRGRVDIPAGGCPSAETWAASCLSLPIYPEMTNEHIEYVAHRVAAACEWVSNTTKPR